LADIHSRNRLGTTMICRFCGEDKIGVLFDDWVRDTFTNIDMLCPGEIVCNDCLFFFDQKSELLQEIMGKDKPQRMQSYSHFIVGGEWLPVSKSNKSTMRRLVTSVPFPELAAISDSGQKHIVFRATRNAPGADAGWVQFETERVWVVPSYLEDLLAVIEHLYAVFSKAEIETGRYSQNRIMQYGMNEWLMREVELRKHRGTILFGLAIFLAQRGQYDTDIEGTSGGIVVGGMEGNTERIQEQIQTEYLGAIRESSEERGLYEQPGEVHQLTMF
jgi:hypothetical protein